jgi:hypothetical protein
MIRYGYEKTWEHWSDYFIKNDLHKKIDFNEISEISNWVKNSVTNNNDIEDAPPEYIIEYLNKLF